MRSPSWLTAGFIAAVLVLLTASLLILSFRLHATLADLNTVTDQTVEIGEEINATFSGEVAALLGFQATNDAGYSRRYQVQRTSIDSRVKRLQPIAASLGPAVLTSFTDLHDAIDAWHRDIAARELTTRQLPGAEFRRVAFQHVFLMKRVQDSTNSFNQTVLRYQSVERARVQRLAYLFMALAMVFGPLALLALLLLIHVLRQLRTTTSYLEERSRDEEVLRQIGQRLNGGFTLDDVLRRITNAIVVSGQADDVWVETVDTSRGEVTYVAGTGSGVPAKGTKGAYDHSLAQSALQDGDPRIVREVDLENRSASIFRDLIRRSDDRSAMVVPLTADQRPLGAMCLMRRTANAFTPLEVRKMRILADMVSIALQRALTAGQLQKIEEEEHFLVRFSAALASSLDYTRTLKTVVHLAVSHDIADWCIVHLTERHRLYHAEVAGADPAKRHLARQLREKHRARPDLTTSVEHAMRTRRASLLRDVTDDVLWDYSVDAEHFDALRQLDLTSAIVVPLTVGPETIGAMVLLASGGRRYDDDDLRRAKKLGRRAAMAIHNAQLYAVANEAIQAREGVLRVVAHDLRNPLNAIQLSAQTLAATSMPYERHQRLLRSITGASERMNRLIEDLLTIGRMGANQTLPLDRHRENPADLVEQVCDIMERQALAKSVSLECAKNSHLPWVMVDRARILQVLTNIVDNALKFTPRGGSTIVSCDGYDGAVRFTVKDTGCGMDPEHLDKVFDPFWQAKETAHLGAGLGLAIAKAIVEQHHGRIWVESKRGGGTTVSFTLPVAGVGEELLSRTA